MDERCTTCHFWIQDYGIFTVTGWTQLDNNIGNCHYDRKEVIGKSGSDFCACWRVKVGR